MDKKIEVKTDKTLSKLLQQICDIYDAFWIDHLCSAEADAYVWESKSRPYADGIEKGVELARKARKSGNPIYHLWCSEADLFFVSKRKDLDSLLQKTLAKAKKAFGPEND